MSDDRGVVGHRTIEEIMSRSDSCPYAVLDVINLLRNGIESTNQWQG